MINQTATNNLNVLIDPTFINVNRLLFCLFQMKKIEELFQNIISRNKWIVLGRFRSKFPNF